MVKLFKKLGVRMNQKGVNELLISIVGAYFYNLSATCDFPEMPSAQLLPHPFHWKPHPFNQKLKEIFVVPSLNKSHQTQNQINKSHFLESFLSLLLQLLYHRTDVIVHQFQDGIDNLEEDLRFLLTILGDMSWMPLDTDTEFLNLMLEFEAVANEAGSFVHYLFFSVDGEIEKTDERLASVLKNTHLLKANLVSSVMIILAHANPTTTVVDSIFIVYSVVHDLEDLLKREDDPIADVKDQLTLLHHHLLLSHSSIRNMRSPQPSEIEELKEPLMNIGGIAHQAEYLITSFLVKDAPLWYVVYRLTDLNHRIEPIRTKLQLITQKYQFGGLKVEQYFSAEFPLHDKTSTEVVNNVTVGFEDKTTDILDQLIGGGTHRLKVISILGMPGLGKTTLANKLYNHPLVNYTFDKLSWCVVSQTYKKQTILANILIHINSELGIDSILDMEEVSLVEHIHKTLMGRRYLIVLDDVWDSNALDELLICFPDDGNGSRILLTSRNKDVAPSNSTLHELPFLTDEQCLELLEKKVFGNRSYPPQLQGISKKIAARCCGLPLMVVVIAGVLSSVDEEERTWEEVGGCLASYINGEGNSVMQILELSYKHLPDHLKPCFLYFGEFEEDEEISVGNLKRLWVAEGFIRKEKDKSVENIAAEYLMELIDRSLVMIAKRRIDGRGAKRCVVHDLLRELCLKKCKEESFLKYLYNDYVHNIYEKGYRVRAYGDVETLSYCQHIRSFSGDRPSDSFYVRDMRLLRVLHFKGIYDRGIAFGLEYLVNLRFLVIHSLPIYRLIYLRFILDTWIDLLVNLEYLRVQWGGTVYLPPAIVRMKKLRYLCAKSAEYREDWHYSNQTNKLEYLSMININNLKDEELLKCSPHLRKLKCNYNHEGMGKSAYPHFDLSFLTQLDSLSLSGKLIRGDFGFPSNITKLTLFGSLLRWDKKISIIGRLEFLEVLKLSSDAFVGERWDTRDGEFQKLRFLQLENIDLCEWNVASTDHFPKLQQLILSYCWFLQEIPSEIGEISTLELIQVKRGCPRLVESAERIYEEQLELGNEELRVIISNKKEKQYISTNRAR